MNPQHQERKDSDLSLTAVIGRTTQSDGKIM